VASPETTMAPAMATIATAVLSVWSTITPAA
jgi:hypothetical protein